MPFIRYDQGNLARYSLRQNAHGETVKAIDRIIGRQDDVAPLPGGRFLTFLNFCEVMKVYLGVDRFRVRQQAPDRFLVELVAGPDYHGAIQGDLPHRLQALSRLPLHFTVHLLDRIDPDPSGKMRVLVSEVTG